MQNQAKPSDLEQRLADFLTKAEEGSLGFPKGKLASTEKRMED
jgi:hypothetical protein